MKVIKFKDFDTNRNINERDIKIFCNVIHWCQSNNIFKLCNRNKLNVGTGFQRLVYPELMSNVLLDNLKVDVNNLKKPILTSSGKEQSSACATYAKKMGLLNFDEKNGVFELSPLGELVFNNTISVKEYCVILLSKQGIYVQDQFYEFFLYSISCCLKQKEIIQVEDFIDYLKKQLNDEDISLGRTDLIFNALEFSGLVDLDLTSNTGSYKKGRHTEGFWDEINSKFKRISPPQQTKFEKYAFMGKFDRGILEILDSKIKKSNVYPNIQKLITSKNTSNFIGYQDMFLEDKTSSSSCIQEDYESSDFIDGFIVPRTIGVEPDIEDPKGQGSTQPDSGVTKPENPSNPTTKKDDSYLQVIKDAAEMLSSKYDTELCHVPNTKRAYLAKNGDGYCFMTSKVYMNKKGISPYFWWTFRPTTTQGLESCKIINFVMCCKSDNLDILIIPENVMKECLSCCITAKEGKNIHLFIQKTEDNRFLWFDFAKNNPKNYKTYDLTEYLY